MRDWRFCEAGSVSDLFDRVEFRTPLLGFRLLQFDFVVFFGC
jgi:hypothetical protein